MVKGDRVALTELRPVDSEALFRWINDPEIVRFNASYLPIHELNHKCWFEHVTQDSTRIVFGIRLINDPRILGMIQLIDVHPVHRSAELVIRIGDEADRNRGIGSEALRLAIKFAFLDRNLHRIWLRVFASNDRAIHAYKKVGFRVEGTLRNACFVDGQWVNQIVMGVLASEER